ncbi:hypothetical protein Tco_1302730 [Tanacetum coccineum]
MLYHHHIKKTQTPRQALNQVTELPQTSEPIPNVPDEAVYEEWDDKVERSTTTTASLDAEQASGGSPRCQKAIGGSIAQTRSERKVESLEADLKQTKKVYGDAYTKLIKKVKKLEKIVKSNQARRRAKIVVSDDEEDLEDSSKQGRMIKEIDQDARVTLVTPTHTKENVHTYTRRRRVVSTSSGGISTASRLFSTAEESVSTAGMVQEQEQERLGHEAAVRLQEELDEEEIQRMARVHEAAQSLLSKNGKTLEQELKLMKSYLGDYKQRKGTSIVKIELDHEGSKKQKTNEASGSVQEQPEEEEKEFSQEDLQQMMMVVPVEEVYVEALQVKYPIIDWEVYTEESRNIRRSSGDDLVMLCNFTKERFSSTEPTDDKERALWVELNRLFEPNTGDTLWKLQRYMHDPLKWRLYDTCRVHHVSIERGIDIFMLVEKEYPLSKGVLTLMLVNRLLVEQHLEMANELLRKIFKQAKRPRQ